MSFTTDKMNELLQQDEEIKRLKKVNAVLLAACKAYHARQRNPLMDFSMLADVTELIDKAIAEAEA